MATIWLVRLAYLVLKGRHFIFTYSPQALLSFRTAANYKMGNVIVGVRMMGSENDSPGGLDGKEPAYNTGDPGLMP